MFYERKIRYLNYFENGERIGGSGFAKFEVRDTTLRIEITIKTTLNKTGTFPIYLSGAEKEASLGEFPVQEGCGIFRQTCCISDEIMGTGIPYKELSGIRIPLGEGREIASSWKSLSAERAAEESFSALKAQEVVEKIELRQDSPKEKEIETAKPEISKPETAKLEREENQSQSREEDKMIRLQEDKWTQLCTIYPHIRPFQDEREYLSISPADFVLLPAADYRTAHNSFLLHGFYNYHHLILTRLERRGEILYYLGVPGNYFEKEKQVAVMFGFESFECAEEPAEYGDFGYYMMRTNI